MAPKQAPPPVEEIAFMSCILKIDVQTDGWQKAVMKVLNGTKGISNFRMDEGGMLEVSGTIDPKLLLKMLGKVGNKAELCWFQFGQCSSNLFLPEQPNDYYYYSGADPYNHGYYRNCGGGGGGYGFYGGNGYYRGNDRYFHGSRLRRPMYSARMIEGDCQKPEPPRPPKVVVVEPPLSGEHVNCCSLM